MDAATYREIDAELLSAIRRIESARRRIAAADRKYAERMKGRPDGRG